MTKSYLYDGLKAVPIDDLPSSAWVWHTPQAEPDDKRQEYYQKVPWLFRGVELRSSAMAALPFVILSDSGDEVDSSADYQNVVGFLPDPMRLFGLIEAALTLLNRAYVFKERNDYRTLSTRYILPTSVTYKVNEETGDIRFKRHLTKGTIDWTPDDLIYFWGADPYVETGAPIASAGRAAIAASGVMLNLDDFAAAFFLRGAIKATILTTEGQVINDEVKKLLKWWGQFISGIKNAWKAAVFNATVKPVVVGEGLSELQNTSLTKEKREDIAVALGIPITKLWSTEAGGIGGAGVVTRDDIVFYRDTIVPESRFISRTMNDQLFAGTGYRLEFRPEVLDVFQADEKERSGSYVAYTSAGMRPSIAAQLLGLELPPGVEYTDLDEDYDNSEEAGGGNLNQGQDVNISLAKSISADLKRWRKKARKNGDAPFVSDAIPGHLAEAVKWAIGEVGGVEAFNFLKQANVSAAERKMSSDVEKVLAKWRPKITGMVTRGEPIDLTGLQNDLNRVLEPQLVSIATEQALRAAQGVGVEFDVAVVNDEAAAWARTYSFELVKGITETTRSRLSKAVETYTLTEGMTRQELEDLIAPIFGKGRADMIAVTEVTRAYAQAANQYQRMIRDEAGVEMARIWRTNADELVCPICGPLNGQPESVWRDNIPEGPPAHVNCRCFLTLEVV